MDDTLIGAAGDDTLVNGTIDYSGGNAVNVDLLAGKATGQGTDTLTQIYNVIGSSGNDVMKAGHFNATLTGGAGDDALYGGTGYDRLNGGTGLDTFYGSGGVDVLFGNGTSVARYETWNGRIVAMLGIGYVDKYDVNARMGSDTVRGVKDLYGTSFGDDIYGTTFDNVLGGLGGNDNISGDAGNDTVDGGDGNDTLDGSYDNDSLLGGAGNDSLIGSSGNDTLVGGTGSDTMVGGDGNDIFYIDDLDDTPVELNGTVEGIDTAYISVKNFDARKLANIENIILVGDGSVIDNNVAPVIGGASSPVTFTTTDIAMATSTGLASPFAAITISDDSPSVTVTVSMDVASKGAFVNLGTGTYNAAAGTYTLTGTVAAVQEALRALQFNAADRPNDAVGAVQTTNFTIAVLDSSNVSAAPNTNISVDSIAVNRAPTLVAPAATLTMEDNENTNLVSPFANVTIGETNADDVVTVRISLDAAAKGVLIPGNGGTYDPASGIFTMTGTVQQVMAAVHALRFNPIDRPGAENNSIETTTFTISVSDAAGATAAPSSAINVDSVHIIQNNAQSAPVLAGGMVAENAATGAVVGTLSAMDPDGDDVTYAFTQALVGSNGLISADGRFEIVDGTIQVRDNALIQVTEDTTFTYEVTASDGHGGATSGNVAITVANVNHAPGTPVLSGGTVAEIAAAGTAAGTLSSTDPDGETITYTFAHTPGTNGLISADGRFEIVNGTIQVRDSALIQVTEDTTFTYEVIASDGHSTTSGNVAITVTNVNVNHAPSVPVLSGGTVAENAATGAVVGALSAADPDGDEVAYAFVQALAGTNGLISADGRFEIVNGTIQVRDNTLIQIAQDTTFTYQVIASDGHGGTTASTVAITVTNVNANHAPGMPILSSATVREHTAIGQTIGTLSATDPDGNVLTYTLLDDSNGRVELVNNELRVKNNTKIDYEQLTSFDLKIAVSDGTAVVSKTVTIGIQNVTPENVIGTAAADLIRGGVGRDNFNGAAGNDTLSGGAGKDVLTGGKGADVFLFDSKPSAANADLIQDFKIRDHDHINLSRSVFKAFGVKDLGKLDSDAFTLGTSAHDKEDRIIYDQASGRIYYDADGTGSGGHNAGPILIATLNNVSTKLPRMHLVCALL